MGKRTVLDEALARGKFDMGATWDKNCRTMMNAFHETRNDLVEQFYRAECWKTAAITGWGSLALAAMCWAVTP